MGCAVTAESGISVVGRRICGVTVMSLLVGLLAGCAGDPPSPYGVSLERRQEQGRAEDVVSQCEALVLATGEVPSTASFGRLELGDTFLSDYDLYGVVLYPGADGRPIQRRYRCTGDDPRDLEVEFI